MLGVDIIPPFWNRIDQATNPPNILSEHPSSMFTFASKSRNKKSVSPQKTMPEHV